MKRMHSSLLITLILGATSVVAFAQTHPSTQPVAVAVPASGYLDSNNIDILRILPAAPLANSPRAKADREIFRKTRALYGTPRWAMASEDVRLKPESLMKDFSCAAGVNLTPQTAPLTAAMVMRAARDTQQSSNTAKLFYKHKRPYMIDKGRTCQPAAELAESPDYPSGHTTYGWTWATLLAEVMPDRASAILARGRAYGESRIVCGVHNASAVEAGLMTASTTLSAVHASKAFQSDLTAARSEIATLRVSSSAARPTQCDAEAALIAEPIMGAY